MPVGRQTSRARSVQAAIREALANQRSLGEVRWALLKRVRRAFSVAASPSDPVPAGGPLSAWMRFGDGWAHRSDSEYPWLQVQEEGAESARPRRPSQLEAELARPRRPSQEATLRCDSMFGATRTVIAPRLALGPGRAWSHSVAYARTWRFAPRIPAGGTNIAMRSHVALNGRW